MAVTKPGYINSYVGFPSFFGAPIIGRDEVKEGMTVVAGVPIDEGINIGRKGARFGPRGIREGTYKYRMVQEMAEDRTTVDLDSHMGFRFKGDELLADIGDLDISPQDIMVTTEGVASGVSDIVRRGGSPVILGGDHYVCYPGFLGFARGMLERHSSPRIGYLHIDSHPDFWDELQAGSRFNHGTSARRISENAYHLLQEYGVAGTEWCGPRCRAVPDVHRPQSEDGDGAPDAGEGNRRSSEGSVGSRCR